jgi:hypothetical protein
MTEKTTHINILTSPIFIFNLSGDNWKAPPEQSQKTRKKKTQTSLRTRREDAAAKKWPYFRWINPLIFLQRIWSLVEFVGRFLPYASLAKTVFEQIAQICLSAP